jgi:hypothetical protein
MGDTYPNAIIEATDLSPIQPTNVPENVQFIIDDAEEEDWAVDVDHYDYIHTRVMMGCFEDFKSIIRKGFKYTKPGGWMESLECMNSPFCDDGTMPPDWPFKEWTETMAEAANNANRPLQIANKLKRWYTEAGFVDIHEKITKIPINSWPRDKHMKTLGKYWAENMLAGLQGFSLALFSRVFGWSKTEIEVRFTLLEVHYLFTGLTYDQIYLVKIRKSITDHNVHAYTKVYTVWGRKPDVSTNPTEDITPTASHQPHQIPHNIVLPRPEDPVVQVPSAVSEDTIEPSTEPAEDLTMSSHPVSDAGSEVTDRPSTPIPTVHPAEIPLPSSPEVPTKITFTETTNPWRMSV